MYIEKNVNLDSIIEKKSLQNMAKNVQRKASVLGKALYQLYAMFIDTFF